jgi:hypothetical protein
VNRCPPESNTGKRLVYNIGILGDFMMIRGRIGPKCLSPILTVALITCGYAFGQTGSAQVRHLAPFDRPHLHVEVKHPCVLGGCGFQYLAQGLVAVVAYLASRKPAR